MELLRLLGLGAIAFASLAASQSTPVSSFCAPKKAVCAAINIPATGDDTFFQITAPTSSGWAGVGIGDQMAGSLIFVIYQNAAGNDVTVSPRIATGHTMPEFSDDFQITMLDGSGIKDNTMTANFKCSNCRKWATGSLNTSGKDGFIWAVGGARQAIQSNELDAQFSEHAAKGTFQLDVAGAKGGDGTQNPFTSGSSSMNNGGEATTAPKSKADKVIIAHGVIMALAFLVIFPLGASAARTFADMLHGKAVLVHRSAQVVGFVLVIIAMAMGVWVSGQNKTHFKHAHQILGIVIIVFLLVQACLGQLHHSIFRKVQRRTIWTHAHIWLGRILILLGVVNGGLGLSLKDATGGEKAAYAVVAVVVVGAVSALRAWRSAKGGTQNVEMMENGVGMKRMRG